MALLLFARNHELCSLSHPATVRKLAIMVFSIFPERAV